LKLTKKGITAIGATLGLSLAVAAFADPGHDGAEQHRHPGMHAGKGDPGTAGAPGAQGGRPAMTPEQRNAMRESMRNATPEQRRQMMASMHEGRHTGMHQGSHAHGPRDDKGPRSGPNAAPAEPEHKH